MGNTTKVQFKVSLPNEFEADEKKYLFSSITETFPSDNYYPGWHLWWRIALANNLGVNSGSFARYDGTIAKELDKAVESMLTRKKIGGNSLLITMAAKPRSQIIEGFESCEEFNASSIGQDCYVSLDKGAIAVGPIGEALKEYLKRMN